jgi:RNA polymerase sigma-70 factor (ECF subfamily)
MGEDRTKQDQERLKELILCAKGGDNAAFEEVYSTYYTPLFRYIVSRIKDRQEALDMTQIVFVKIWNALPRWNTDHTSPLSFFFTVARNTLIDYFRKNAHKEIVSDEIVSIFAEENGTSDEASTARELGEALRNAVSQLSSEQQEIITLYYTHDRTYKEIAQITGKREDTIRQIHSRAIKKLRSLYEQ